MRPAHPDSHHLLIGEAEARRLLLVQALESVDAQGRLVGPEERDRIENEALAATGDPARGQRVDARAWLLARADGVLDVLRHRQPRLAALADPPAWHAWAAWVLPLLALVAGGLVDRIDNPRQVNLLSPPLLAFLLWNLAVYVAIVVIAVWPAHREGGEARRSPWLGVLERRWGGLRGDVAKAFAARWWLAAGPLEGQRWRRILHTAAAAWAVGVAVSIVLGGLVREYRVGWESTLLDLPQVHALLSALFSPVVALLPIDAFSQAEVARLHFGSGADVGRAEARRWVGLYVALLVLVVVVPRALLAAWAGWRQHRLARRVAIDLREPGIAAVLARVHPVRLHILLTVADGVDPTAALTVFRQAGDVPAPAAAEVAWTVLTSTRGDALVLVRTPPLQGRGADGPAWWRRARDLVGRVPAEAAGVQPDLAVVVAPDGSSIPEASCPVLLLTTRAGGAAGALPGAPRREALPLQLLPTWRADERLREALQRLLPAHHATGAARLWLAWREQAERRLARCCELLADELLTQARDAEPLPVQPLGVRQLVVRSERDAAQDARRTAMRQIAGRVQERLTSMTARLASLHGVGPVTPAAAWIDGEHQGFQVHQAVDAPQAGLAGAASGAAMGATVDLMAGGLTLGAASALGALVGGGAALAAAAWKNRGGDNALVLLDDGQLLALAASALGNYLAVAQAGRLPAFGADRLHAVAREVLAGRADALREGFASARHADADARQAAIRLAHEMQAAALEALDRLQA